MVLNIPIILASFDKLLEQSDFVSLHGLLNEQTQKMMNREAFLKMKQGSFLSTPLGVDWLMRMRFAMRLSLDI